MLFHAHDFASIACEKYISNADQPLSFPQWFLFYCPFTNLWQWRLHCGKMVCILAYSVAVRPLYHSDTMIKSSLVDTKSFRSDHQAKL